MTDSARLLALPLPAFLRAIGKREVRPGGTHGWKMAAEMLGPTQGRRVLLVSTHWKRGRLPASLQGADVTSIEALPSDYDSTLPYDVVVLEDELSYLDGLEAGGVVSTARRLLGPSGRLIIHELMWRQTPSYELRSEMQRVWGRMPTPRLMSDWWSLTRAQGFAPPTAAEGGSASIGALPWFRPKQLDADEGVGNGTSYSFNALNSPARSRFIDALDHFTKHDRAYGWVVLSCRLA